MFSMLEINSQHATAISAGLDTLAFAVRAVPITDDTSSFIATTLLTFANTDSFGRSLELLYSISVRACQEYLTAPGCAIPRCVLQLLAASAAVVRDTRTSVSSQAIDVFQRLLVLPQVRSVSADGWESLLVTLMFPLLTDLVDARVNIDVIQRAFAITTKAFLHSLSQLVPAGAVARVWRLMLSCASSCMRAKSEILAEAIIEALKNMLLVLASSQALPEDAWGETWITVDSLCPGLKGELTTAMSPPVSPPSPRSAASAPSPPTIPIVQTPPYPSVAASLINSAPSIVSSGSASPTASSNTTTTATAPIESQQE